MRADEPRVIESDPRLSVAHVMITRNELLRAMTSEKELLRGFVVLGKTVERHARVLCRDEIC